MHDLSGATFIIPVRIDSMDRAFNFQYVVNYLCRNLITNIKIYEAGPTKIAGDLLAAINPIRCKIDYEYLDDGGAPFHRTRYLNEMLADCKTPVVVNYDADVLLKPETYLAAYNKILMDGVDLCYPYFQGNSQIMVFRPGFQDDLTVSAPIRHEIRDADCGFVQFFKRTSYVSGGMENEEFISYGPEDYERRDRFIKLGYKVEWLPESYVYHIEHSRGADSTRENPHFENNNNLYGLLSKKSREEIFIYYSGVNYRKKYTPFIISLITYSDNKYADKRERLEKRAFQLQTIDKHYKWTRDALVETDFYKKNKQILDLEIGGGYWAWKPYIILRALENAKENEVFVYLDSGDWITSPFRDFLNKKMRNHDILLLDGSYINEDWTKDLCFKIMDADSLDYRKTIQLEAGVVVVRKTSSTIDFIKKWLFWCTNKDVVCDDDLPQINPNFKQHRRDQSILTNLKVKFKKHSTSEMRKFITCNY